MQNYFEKHVNCEMNPIKHRTVVQNDVRKIDLETRLLGQKSD